jgi:salicylate hydroxylase
MAYPIASGKLVNVVAYVSDPSKEGTRFDRKWETPTTSDEVTAHYEDWEPQALAITKVSDESPLSLTYKCLPSSTKCMTKVSAWAIHVLESLPHYVHGRVAVLGDAVGAFHTGGRLSFLTDTSRRSGTCKHALYRLRRWSSHGGQ